jgi:hypothetical protein
MYRKLLDLRSDFVERIRKEGYKPSLTAPKIEMGDPPTFGNYDAEKNVLYIAIWSKLSTAERQHFEDIAKNLGPDATPRGVFEAGTDRWVFTHELGHWWQACQHTTRTNSYALEMGANRIASAYWRQRDPNFMQRMVEGFRTVRESIPNPVPKGESKISFLDSHFDEVSATDAYTWVPERHGDRFGCRESVAVISSRTFTAALSPVIATCKTRVYGPDKLTHT